MADELINLEELQKVLQDYAKEAEEVYKYQISLGGKNASRKLTDTIKSNVVVGDQAYEVTLTLQEYWKYIESGRAPGKFPPVKALLDWISVKPIIPRPDANGRIPSQKSLAFLIGRSISENGTEGTHDLEKTKEGVIPWYKQRIAAALGHDMEHYIRKLVVEK